MATIILGSARHDENGKYTGGTAGDQLQTSSTNDTAGEVSMQNFYLHTKGWKIIRAKSATLASKLAERMKAACNNAHIGYDLSGRAGVVTKGIDTKNDTECDCSSLVRACVKEASGNDPGNFTTENEATVLGKTGLFEDTIDYVSATSTPLCTGDILVTKTKGHTAIVVSGNARSSSGTATITSSSKLTVDGIMGTNTTKRAQEVFGTTVDGAIDGQLTAYKSILKGITTCKYVSKKGNGSEWVKALQKKIGATIDGFIGPATILLWQKWMGTTQDGKISSPSALIKAFQTWLNKQ